MITQEYKDMLGAKSVIRQMSEWAAGRAKEIGSCLLYTSDAADE